MSDRLLLIELGVEEVPARMLEGAARDLAGAVADLLDASGIAHGEVRPLWAARRLALFADETASATEEKKALVTGPPAKIAWGEDGELSKAGAGFARKQGVDPDRVERVETDKGDYAAVRRVDPPVALATVLAEGLERSLTKLTFPKTMRWGEGRHTFVRPVKWLVAMHGREALGLSVMGVPSGRVTFGHRALAPGPHELAQAADYVDVLERAFVTVDPERRKGLLDASLREVVREAGAGLVDDEELLAEVANVVEYPGAVAGALDQRFIDELPGEVLETCLRHHQMAFTASAGEGLAPLFAVAVNLPRDPEGHVRRGNEWVVSGRLEDALFFWREDRRRPLSDREGNLDGVTFHARIGTLAQKTRRVGRLAEGLGASAGLDRAVLDASARAATLSRCDLTTGLVGEFPELQGVAGGLLARAEGEPEDVWRAVYDFYRPAGQRDALPATPAGAVLGLADRLDTLAGAFSVGMKPTGSKDPFGLRRAAFGAVRLARMLDGIDLNEAVRRALDETEGREPDPSVEGLDEQVFDFLFERFALLAAAEGARHDEIASVRPVARSRFVPADLFARLEALQGFRDSEDFLALASASKRIRKILEQARGEGGTDEAAQGDGIDAAKLVEPAETELLAAVEGLQGDVSGHREALSRFATLRPAVDRFFDDVLVMDPDPGLRRARLGLLARLDTLARGVVDVSHLVVEKAAQG